MEIGSNSQDYKEQEYCCPKSNSSKNSLIVWKLGKYKPSEAIEHNNKTRSNFKKQ